MDGAGLGKTPITILHAIDQSLQNVLCELVGVSARARSLVEQFEAEDRYAYERSALHVEARIDGLLRQVCFAVGEVHKLEHTLGGPDRVGRSTTNRIGKDGQPLPRIPPSAAFKGHLNLERGWGFPEPPHYGLTD